MGGILDEIVSSVMDLVSPINEIVMPEPEFDDMIKTIKSDSTTDDPTTQNDTLP